MEKIRCTVQRVLFCNRENGYTVFSAIPEEGYKPFIVQGTYYIVSAGAKLTVEGEWVVDKKYGRQFAATSWSEIVPETKEGIERYLAGGNIPGIGPKTAKIIVAAFGEETFDIIKNEPERLMGIPGIGKTKVERICANIRQQNVVRDIIVFLQGYGISSNFAHKIHQLYGADSIRQMKENPYCLADDIVGVGFKSADKIALNMGYSKDDSRRVRCGILYVMNHPDDGSLDKSDKGNKGDSYQDRDALVRWCVRILEVDPDIVENCIDELLRSESLIADGDNIYLPMFYWSEVGIGRRLSRIASYESFTSRERYGMSRVLNCSAVKYNQKQMEAIQLSVSSKVMVLTGGPGTGKTTTLLGIIKVMEENYDGKGILLAAPTGRAAKRMSEATNHNAKTIHRLLEFNFTEGFKRNENNPLKGSVLIVDESSMIDQLLMNSLLKAVPAHMRVILVGDIDQLPSVGAGNVLQDIIESGCVPVVRLTEVFRQAAESRIIRNAHRVNNGYYPEVKNDRHSDFFFIEAQDDEKAAELVVDLVTKRIPRAYSFKQDEIQVLSPRRERAATAVENLNKLIQEIVNPEGDYIAFGQYKFRKGDRVMQMKNNYEHEVFNGDIGTIEYIDMEDRMMTVNFYGNRVLLKEHDLEDLSLAYACTIHKSQGSEYPVVVIPMMSTAFIMLQRKLLYTAITRAKKLCIIVGTKQSIWQCVSNTYVQPRNTMLRERIIECFNGFSQEQLKGEWLAMCERMPQRLSGIATRMKNFIPIINSYCKLEVEVPNQLVLDSMEEIKQSIVNTLRLKLRNKKLTLNLYVAK